MSRVNNTIALLGLALTLGISTAHAQEQARETLLSPADAPYAFSLHAEIGFLAPLAHSIQFGKEGTNFDYIAEGGQDNLFPFMRISAETELWDHHNVVLLYQPLQLVSSVKLRRDLVADDVTFPEGTPMDLTYGFDFWRLSYLYDFFEAPETELAIGASLQIRNATIAFESQDGMLGRYTRDIGPVPIIKVRGRTDLGPRFWVGGEFDGFWAPIRYINGSSSDVEGAIADLSVRGGVHLLQGVDAFLGLRYLGGGARGTSNSEPNPGDDYVNNWLHFGSVTLGFTVR